MVRRRLLSNAVKVCLLLAVLHVLVRAQTSLTTIQDGAWKPLFNDRDFDVALHIVFEDRKAHDQYQDAARHKQFIDENKESWKKVRVFDSYAD